jgi:hypothetical protein
MNEEFRELFEAFCNDPRIDLSEVLKLFQTDSFCACIMNEEVRKLFEALRKSIAKQATPAMLLAVGLKVTTEGRLAFGLAETLRLFQNNSFCARILESQFRVSFELLISELGLHWALMLFRQGKIFEMILQPGFVPFLQKRLEAYNEERTVKTFKDAGWLLSLQNEATLASELV